MYGCSDSNVLNRRTPASIELCKRRAFGFSTRPAVTMRPATEESQLIYESKVKYEFSSLPIGISFLPSRVLLSRQSRPNYAAICMHHRHHTNMQSTKSLSFLFFSKPEPARHRDLLRLCLSFLSIKSHTVHIHTVIFHHMQNTLFFFFFFFVFLLLAKMVSVSKFEFRRSLSLGSCVGERENVVPKVDL
jgi:hypothetical protein